MPEPAPGFVIIRGAGETIALLNDLNLHFLPVDLSFPNSCDHLGMNGNDKGSK